MKNSRMKKITGIALAASLLFTDLSGFRSEASPAETVSDNTVSENISVSDNDIQTDVQEVPEESDYKESVRKTVSGNEILAVAEESAEGEGHTLPVREMLVSNYSDIADTFPSDYILPQAEQGNQIKGIEDKEKGGDWAYALCSALESGLKKKYPEEKISISREALVSCLYNENKEDQNDKYGAISKDIVIDPGQGRGNVHTAMWAAAAGYAVKNTDAPDLKYRLHNINMYHGREKNKIKNAVMLQGEVAVSLYRLEDCFNDNKLSDSSYKISYYCPDDRKPQSGMEHAVTIVGWDDRYPRGFFQHADCLSESQDGAWLVKDPYGYNGENYYWVSYYDTALYNGYVNCYSFDIAKDSPNAHTYQYDGGGGYFMYGAYNCAKAVNIFPKAGLHETVSAVSFGTYTQNAKYKIQVYLEAEPAGGAKSQPVLKKPLFKNPVTTQEYSRWGYYTVGLEQYREQFNCEPVISSRDENAFFAVEITIVEGKNFLPGDIKSFWIDGANDSDWSPICRPDASASGQSYVYKNTKWMDFGQNMPEWKNFPQGKGSNIRIKAHTQEKIALEAIEGNEVWIGENLTLRASIGGQPVEESESLQWSSDREEVASVSAGGTVIPKSPGYAQITVTSETYGSDTVKIMVKDVSFTDHFLLCSNSVNKEKRTGKIACDFYPSEYQPDQVEYKVKRQEDTRYLYFDEAGNVTAKPEAESREDIPILIVISDKERQITKEVKVSCYQVPKEFKITGGEQDTQGRCVLGVSQQRQLGIDIIHPAGAKEDIFWKSSNAAVVSVTPGGRLCALKEGTAVITAASRDNPEIQDQIKVTVKNGVSRLSLSESHINLLPNESRKLEIKVFPESPDHPEIKWRMTDLDGNELALQNGTVSFDPASGTLTAGGANMKNTQVKLYAECGGAVTSCFIRVNIPLANVRLSFSKNTLITVSEVETSASRRALEPIMLYGHFEPQIISDAPPLLFYSTDNPEIARVTDSGEVIPIKTGSVQLTAQTPGGVASAPIRLTIRSIYTNRILSLQSEEPKIYVNGWAEKEPKTTRITVTADGRPAPGEDFYWESSDETIAAVDENGNVTAVSGGTVTITATDKLNDSNKAKINLQTGIGVRQIRTERDYYEIALGCTALINCNVTPSDADGKALSFSAENKQIVKCTGKEIYALKEGTTVVSIETENGIKKQITVKVNKQKANSLWAVLLGGYLTTVGTKDSRAPIQAEATDKNGNSSGVSQIFKYESGNPDILQVDADGFVTGGVEGETFVRVSTTDGSNLNRYVYVEVRKQDSGIKSVVLNHSKVELGKDKNLYLLAAVLPENAPGLHEVTWSSMDETVAVVDSYGAVRTKGYGKTYIVAESLDGTKSAACEIKVLPMESRIKLRKINDQILENNSVNPDSSYRISVMADDGKDYGAYCEFSSSNPDVCTVNENGLIVPAENAVTGKSTITVKLKNDLLGRKTSFKVTLTDEKQAAGIKVCAALATGEQEVSPQVPLYLPSDPGREIKLTGFVMDRNGGLIEDGALKWSVSDKKMLAIADLGDGKAGLCIKGNGSCVLTCAVRTQPQVFVSVPVYIYDTKPVLTEKSLTVNLLKKESLSLPIQTCAGTEVETLSLAYIRKGKQYLDDGFTIAGNSLSGYTLQYDAEYLDKGSYTVYARAVIKFDESEEGKRLKDVCHNQDSLTGILEIPVQVTRRQPQMKVKQPTINVFEKNAVEELKITTQTEIDRMELSDGKTGGIAQKFSVEKKDGSFLLHARTQDKGTHHAVLQIYFKDYVDPVPIKCTIKTVITKPRLSVSPEKIFVYKGQDEEASVSFSLRNPEENEWISEQNGYVVSKGGTLKEDRITVSGLDKYGKKTLEITVENSELWTDKILLKVPVVVEDERKIALETSQAKISLNRRLANDHATVRVYMKQKNITISAVDNINFYDSKGRLSDHLQWEVKKDAGEYSIEFRTRDYCEKGTYKAEITASAANGKKYTKSMKVSVEDILPTVKVKLKGSIDLYNRTDTCMTGTASVSHTASEIADITSDREDFTVVYDRDTKQFTLSLKPYNMISKKKQTVMLNILLSNGDILKKAVNITLRQSKIKWEKQEMPVLYKSKGSKSVTIPVQTESPADADVRITVLGLPEGIKADRTERNSITVSLDNEKLKPGKYKIRTAVRLYDFYGSIPMDGAAVKKDIVIQVK